MATMTIQQFLRSQDAFAARFGDVVVGDEQGFSWRPCGCCDISLGGNRHAALTVARGTGAVTWEGTICDDCVLFHANGDLPDLPGMDEYLDSTKRSKAAK